MMFTLDQHHHLREGRLVLFEAATSLSTLTRLIQRCFVLLYERYLSTSSAAERDGLTVAEWQASVYEDDIPFIWKRHTIISGSMMLVRGDVSLNMEETCHHAP